MHHALLQVWPEQVDGIQEGYRLRVDEEEDGEPPDLMKWMEDKGLNVAASAEEEQGVFSFRGGKERFITFIDRAVGPRLPPSGGAAGRRHGGR